MRKENWMFAAVLMAVMAGTAAFPHSVFAAGAPWETALQTVVSYMTGSTARLIAILAVAGVGLSMLAGQISVRTALGVILGIAVIFGSATIVDMFAN